MHNKDSDDMSLSQGQEMQGQAEKMGKKKDETELKKNKN